VSAGRAFDDLLAEDVHAPATRVKPPVSTSTPSRGPKSKKGSHVLGNPARRDQSRVDYAAIRSFATWLRDQPSIAAPSVEEEVQVFEALLESARSMGINPNVPSGLERLVDEVCLFDKEEDRGIAMAALATLDDYVHFRLLTSSDHSGWMQAHDEVELAMDEVDPGMSALEEVIETADQIDPEILREAYCETRIVAMVSTLLEWIGKGRKCSSTGVLRRVDIEEAAAMLGVRAVGVNKLPPYDPNDMDWLYEGSPLPPTVYARSMLDVPLLAPWWMALRTAEVIQTTSTMVRPGPAASEWLAEKLPPLDLAEKVIGIFIAETIIEDLRNLGWYNEQVVAMTVRRLMDALAPDFDVPDEEEDAIALILKQRVTNKLRLLEQMGIVEMAGDECTIPPVLRGVVARGLLVTAALVEQITVGEE